MGTGKKPAQAFSALGQTGFGGSSRVGSVRWGRKRLVCLESGLGAVQETGRGQQPSKRSGDGEGS